MRREGERERGREGERERGREGERERGGEGERERGREGEREREREHIFSHSARAARSLSSDEGRSEMPCAL